MKRISVSRARRELPDLIRRVSEAGERVVLTGPGDRANVAALIPIDDLKLLERLTEEEMDRIDIEDARAALQEVAEQGTISWAEACERLGL